MAQLSEMVSAEDTQAWPRSYELGKDEVAFYQPQILEWDEFRKLEASVAIAVKLDGQEPTFGAMTVSASTVVDQDKNSVRIGARTLGDIKFPELEPADATKAKTLVTSVMTPDRLLDVPLDSMLAAMNRADSMTDETNVNLDPPPIFYSDSLSILVTFFGEPELKPVIQDDTSLLFAVNTNWDVLFDTASSKYYLLAETQWVMSSDVKAGPWEPAKSLPDSFKKIPNDENWSDVTSRLGLLGGAAQAPRVFVSDQPAELIQTQGAPQMSPVSGTRLMYVTNTEDDLFFLPAQKNYYYLTAGRWFAALDLNGPWTAASLNLPEDFQKIPEDHVKAYVRVSVPGTPEADEAIILASIPDTATVNRESATVEVIYDGEPKFEPVPGADGVKFAVNTEFDVFMVGDAYYCCYQGVWFEAKSPTGPWVVCDKVPAAIYSIPPESPKHNVTYVQVYESTPSTVVVGSTSGYSGSYVARGLLVFGLGYWLGHSHRHDHVHHYHYYRKPYWYGYGHGCHYRYGSGYVARGGYRYGPYGGAGYAAAYNPRTGTYARGGYAYGPRGAAAGKAAYNPWTGKGAARGGVKTPYGSWGRSAVVRDDDWARSAHRSNWKGSVRGVQTSEGGGAVRVNRKYGKDGFIGKTGNGDVYTGRDGNLYRKTDDGWEKRQNGGWQSAPEPNRAARTSQTGNRQPQTRPTTRPSTNPTTRPSTNPTTRPSTNPNDRTRPSTTPQRSGYTNRQNTPSQLNRDAYSRQRSHTQSSKARSSNRGSSNRSSGSSRSSRGGGRSGGSRR
ncbi:hypothetical protein [Oceaniferula marina]|uniref:hypothetical protein n=1 Tax=Oceaniferula marina TaxID=2748318 RepID=UPI0015B7B259|nr:hypothetical protein [Oceaniferula marina]